MKKTRKQCNFMLSPATMDKMRAHLNSTPYILSQSTFVDLAINEKLDREESPRGKSGSTYQGVPMEKKLEYKRKAMEINEEKRKERKQEEIDEANQRAELNERVLADMSRRFAAQLRRPAEVEPVVSDPGFDMPEEDDLTDEFINMKPQLGQSGKRG
jgi:hypothetical protein